MICCSIQQMKCERKLKKFSSADKRNEPLSRFSWSPNQHDKRLALRNENGRRKDVQQFQLEMVIISALKWNTLLSANMKNGPLLEWAAHTEWICYSFFFGSSPQGVPRKFLVFVAELSVHSSDFVYAKIFREMIQQNLKQYSKVRPFNPKPFNPSHHPLRTSNGMSCFHSNASRTEGICIRKSSSINLPVWICNSAQRQGVANAFLMKAIHLFSAHSSIRFPNGHSSR